MASMHIGMPHPTRPGYFLAGFARCVKHPKTGKVLFPKKGKAFPIWRKAA